MPSANPLKDVKNIVVAGIGDYAMVQALNAQIKAYDRSVDVRGEFDDQPTMGKRIRIASVKSSLDLVATSDNARLLRRFEIGIGSGSMREDDLLDMEWAVMCAARNMYEGKAPDGLSAIVPPDSMSIETITVTDCDPERQPIDDPEEWWGVCDLIVEAFYPRALFFPALL